jgi:hypothetical protein
VKITLESIERLMEFLFIESIVALIGFLGISSIRLTILAFLIVIN